MSNNNESCESGLFYTSKAAIAFALRLGGSPDRPAMNRALDKREASRPPPKFSSWEEAASQAGAILDLIERLGADKSKHEMFEAILIARCADRILPCSCGSPCCIGSFINPTWAAAVSVITDCVAKAPNMPRTDRMLRLKLCMKLFGIGKSISQIATAEDVDRVTASTHFARIKRYIEGQEASGSNREIEGQEHAAWRLVDAEFKRRGIVAGT